MNGCMPECPYFLLRRAWAATAVNSPRRTHFT
jgi:hypothetical protein